MPSLSEYVSVNINKNVLVNLSVRPTESIGMKMNEFMHDCEYELNCDFEGGYECERCCSLMLSLSMSFSVGSISRKW